MQFGVGVANEVHQSANDHYHGFAYKTDIYVNVAAAAAVAESISQCCWEC